MAELIGMNDVGIEVWEIEEGGLRPLVLDDGSGRINCRICGATETPGRIRLNLWLSTGIEWAVMYCPKCEQAHYMMRVQLDQKLRRVAVEEGADLQVKNPPLSIIEKERMVQGFVDGSAKVKVVDNRKGQTGKVRKLGVQGYNPTITAPPSYDPSDREPEPDA